jgi:heat shock protein beta
MLDIVVNSLYQNKDVFLRELISNASDALDKIRFLSLTNPELLNDAPEFKIEIEYDPANNSLVLRDTGIGMTHDEMVSNLGTVARSGTTKFMQALKEKGESQSGELTQIGQFGVGFYSAFLVADRIQVASKHPESDAQNVWTSANGASEFQIYPDPRGNTLTRGTEVTLFLKEDCVEYADPYRLQALAKHYSEFVMHPIHLRTIETVQVEVEDEEEEGSEEMKEEGDLEIEEDDEEDKKPKKMKDVTTYEWERLNGNPAIWTRSKEDITDDEYQSFWKVVAKNEHTSDATTWTHFNAEGNINFKSILYLPTDIPESYKFGNIQNQNGLSLYVRKVLISDEFELLPRYLGFIRGVVDSDDLPLNVNRETLQESKIIKVIQKKLVRKAIDMIRQFMKESEDEEAAEEEKDPEYDGDGNVVEKKKEESKYIKWYKNFSPSLKMGVMDDGPNQSKLLKLLRFQTSKSNKEWISLEQYIENMKEWQDEIYMLAGTNLEAVEKSQFLEPFIEKEVEVIYLTDAVDEYMTQHARTYDSKKFIQISSESVNFKDENEDLVTRREKYYKKQFKPLTKWLKKLYGMSVMRVAISKRLGSAPAIASSSSHGHSANMERIMRAQAFNHGQEEFSMQALKVFEINPRHPLVIKLLDGCPPENEGDEPFEVAEDVIDAAWILHEMALLNGGFPLTDPQAHTRRLTKFLQSTLGVESLKLEPEVDPPEEEEEAPAFDTDDFAGGINMDDFNMDGINMEDLNLDAMGGDEL